MKEFDVENITLKGNNLIEASAGTGKTYSIGILVLRLLLENNIRIEQILMVTFTNAAVAELEIRTRNFLREAKLIISSTNNQKESDSTIKFIVDRAIKVKGKDEVIKILSNAILFLDETSIFTIHSFCQLTLSEFAFETKQLFNTELIEDQTVIIEDSVNDFWRKKITTLDLKILKVLLDKNYSRETLIDFMKNIFDGKKLSIRNSVEIEKTISTIDNYKLKIESADKNLTESIKSEWSQITNTNINKNSNLYKLTVKNDQEGFKSELIKVYSKNSESPSLVNLNFLFEGINQLLDNIDQFEQFKTNLFIEYLSQAEKFISADVKKKKNRNQVLSFYDLIEKLHLELVVNNNFDLKSKLCNKYKAVFIDEFQDTDHLQYEIFRKAFVDNCESTVFFIGDPKQSIYAWRGADLKTYIKAQKDIGGNKFTMRNNFRSSSSLISAMNEFFPAGTSCKIETTNTSDPFCTIDINYEIVSPGNTNIGDLFRNNEPSKPFEIIQHSGKINKSVLFEAAGLEIIDLLSNHSILKNDERRPVLPEDIRVLVRNRKETKEMKDVLSKYNIPAIIIDETKIMESDVAADVFYILVAIDNPNSKNISRALLTSIIGFSIESLSKQDLLFHKKHFLELQEVWKKSGIFSSILNLIKKYSTQELLLNSNNPKGNRIYTNLIQILEILNEKELYSNYSSDKLIEWFQKSREGLNSINKYEQRIESDENAVEILTIHKSKGLSFNIVILPQINLAKQTIKKDKSITFLKDDGFYLSYNKTENELDLYNFQNEQENRRLIYVAITRAVYKCIIHYNDKAGSLKYFIPNIDPNSSNINFREPLAKIDYQYSIEKNVITKNTPRQFTKKLYNKWKLTSYSGLDKHEKTYSVKRNEYIENNKEYDKFVLEQLSKGAQTGNILHNILEKIDFTNNTFWNKTIEKNLQLFGREVTEKTIHHYHSLLTNTVQSSLFPNNFNLSKIKSNQRFNELEFYFSFDNWKISEIKSIFPNINISDNNIEGIMHGFIDLLFEYEDKFYILDWKSNHLGYKIEDYSLEDTQQAMDENNYHLQYIIYTIAVKRFLEKRIFNFDYDLHFGGTYYLFLRGLRSEEKSGVFFNRIDKEKILKLDSLLS